MPLLQSIPSSIGYRFCVSLRVLSLAWEDDHRYSNRNDSILELSDHARCLVYIAKALLIVRIL